MESILVGERPFATHLWPQGEVIEIHTPREPPILPW